MYQNMYRETKPIMPNPNFNDGGDRFFPLFFPFLGGALLGGAAVAVSRPRPIVNVAPQPYPPYPAPYPVYPYGAGYNYGNYGYYNYR